MEGAAVVECSEFLLSNEVALFGEKDTLALRSLLMSLLLGAKLVNREIQKAGLVGILGDYGAENVQGEQQQKLDVFAHNSFVQTLNNRGVVCGICSEEVDEIIQGNPESEFLILMDPLDGSSNIDVNVSVGTIFSVLRRVTPKGTPAKVEDFLQKGSEQVLAGYILYGSCTMLVCAFKDSVHGFTLDQSLGSFYHSHPNLLFPKNARVYSINEGNYNSFTDGVKNFIELCQVHEKFSARYIGSLVSDFHRNLLQGGVYVYPETQKDKRGKLRLLYECSPIAMIAEKAGGKASDGVKPILSILPQSLHERTPLATGVIKLVDYYEECLAQCAAQVGTAKKKQEKEQKCVPPV